jgi:hypothetical protein
MRSIGKRNITKLKKIIKDELDNMNRFDQNYSAAKERIIAKLPAEWWDIWEMAHQEIHQIVDDEVMEYAILS